MRDYCCLADVDQVPRFNSHEFELQNVWTVNKLTHSNQKDLVTEGHISVALHNYCYSLYLSFSSYVIKVFSILIFSFISESVLMLSVRTSLTA